MRRTVLRWSAVAGCVVVLAVLAFIVFGPDPSAPAAVAEAPTTTRPAPTTTTTTEPELPPVPVAATVADAKGSTVDLFSEPDVVDAERPTMDNPTHEGLPVVFLVLEEKGPWLRVQVSMRPNERVAWVKRSQVVVRTVPNRIVVRLAERRLVVYEGTEGDDELLSETVAIGSSRTPTPTGRFFVDGWVPLDGTGPYGAGQLSVAGFSDVLQSFGGGVGQIAIHGTNSPGLLGQAVSNGCVRMQNDALLRLIELAPLGTPVEIVP